MKNSAIVSAFSQEAFIQELYNGVNRYVYPDIPREVIGAVKDAFGIANNETILYVQDLASSNMLTITDSGVRYKKNWDYVCFSWSKARNIGYCSGSIIVNNKKDPNSSSISIPITSFVKEKLNQTQKDGYGNSFMNLLSKLCQVSCVDTNKGDSQMFRDYFKHMKNKEDSIELEDPRKEFCNAVFWLFMATLFVVGNVLWICLCDHQTVVHYEGFLWIDPRDEVEYSWNFIFSCIAMLFTGGYFIFVFFGCINEYLNFARVKRKCRSKTLDVYINEWMQKRDNYYEEQRRARNNNNINNNYTVRNDNTFSDYVQAANRGFQIGTLIKNVLSLFG